MWIICLADDSFEMQSLIFSEKYLIYHMYLDRQAWANSVDRD